MAVGVIPMAVVSAFWGVIGIIVPFLIPKGPNAGLTRLMLVLTAVCCWLFWLCAYLSQINPLFGPQLHTTTLAILQRQWPQLVKLFSNWRQKALLWTGMVALALTTSCIRYK